MVLQPCLSDLFEQSDSFIDLNLFQVTIFQIVSVPKFPNLQPNNEILNITTSFDEIYIVLTVCGAFNQLFNNTLKLGP